MSFKVGDRVTIKGFFGNGNSGLIQEINYEFPFCYRVKMDATQSILGFRENEIALQQSYMQQEEARKLLGIK